LLLEWEMCYNIQIWDVNPFWIIEYLSKNYQLQVVNMVFKIGFLKFSPFWIPYLQTFFFNVYWNAIVTFHPMLIEICDKRVLQHLSRLAITHSIMWNVRYKIKFKYKLILVTKMLTMWECLCNLNGDSSHENVHDMNSCVREIVRHPWKSSLEGCNLCTRCDGSCVTRLKNKHITKLPPCLLLCKEELFIKKLLFI
jgi:hypothetical protein